MLSPCLSSLKAFIMVWTQSFLLSLLPGLPPSVSPCVSTHLLLGSRLYIMQTPLSIIYLHMYHSCFQPFIIHQLLEASLKSRTLPSGLRLSSLLSPAGRTKTPK